MQRPPSSQKTRNAQQQRVMERNSLPNNNLALKHSDYLPYRDPQDFRIPRQRESLNYRSEHSKEHALRSSIDFLNKNRSQAESDAFLNDYKNFPSNYRTEVSKKPNKYTSDANKGGNLVQTASLIDRNYIPNISNSGKNLRKTHTDHNVMKRNGTESVIPSPLNMPASKYTSMESMTSVNFPKVDDRLAKANQHSKNVPYNPKPYGTMNTGSVRNVPAPVLNGKQSQATGSSNQIQSYNIDSLNGSLTTSADQRTSIHNSSQEKERNSRNYQNQTSIQKGSQSKETNANSNSNANNKGNSQNSMQIYSGLTNKNITLLPARSSSFLFNGKEAIYSVNTTNGLIRGYNEDRVSIVINIKRKSDWKHSRWPNCSYFSIFDGHGGSLCADFLKDNLHRFILENQHFPENPSRAIEEGCAHAEHEFCKFALKQKNIDKSGSCALIVLIIDDKIYIGNVGDCRAIGSEQGGKQFYSLTKDHKPEEPSEQERITRNGGQVSKNNFLQSYKMLGSTLGGRLNDLPFRVYPGGLSVSRSFGDVIAKEAQFGGNPNVLIAKAEISTYRIDRRTDFIFIGCKVTR
jgi:serine/threonine protein phosphatase PrpC